ncbi:MAG TPA: type IV pilus twitching motility protein PilT [Polyangiaceae bacterium]|nr:type IV pilus twitching motility protein PilT [Polyangiaceae bacterium]
MSQIVDLLKRALLVGAKEVRLIPGRRTIVVVPAGESEVKGEPQTLDTITALISPVMTQQAKQQMTTGFAEWDFELEGRGPVRARAEVKGALQVSFFLDRCQTLAQQGSPARAPAPAPAPPPVAAPAPLPQPFAPSFHGMPAVQVNSGIGLDTDELDIPRGGVSGGSLGAAPSAAPVSRPGYDNSSADNSSKNIDKLLNRLLELKGSDLHISTGAPPMMRVDGEMRSVEGYDILSGEQVTRMLLAITPDRNREEFERTHDADFAYELPGKARFRANIFVDLKGMGAVMRVIPSKILTVDDLNLPKELLTLCHLPKGLVLVTGPTGSGKSTTLAALVDYINRTRSDHIITIEDPVEFVHPNKKCLVNQRQVGEHTDSFKKALRAALREDPDIVLLGEMRDLETIAIALETAETGHLVFGTLHTSSAPSTIDRIIDQYPPEQQEQIRVMLANSLKGVIAQMLCKKIGGGRVAALEVMFGVPAIANLIREKKVFQINSIMQTGRKQGMCLMNDSLFKLVKDGVVTPEEALAKANDKTSLLTAFQSAGIKVDANAG